MIPFISIDATETLQKLQALSRGIENDEPARMQMGELAVLSTRQRFVMSQSPSGETWQPLSPTTIMMFIQGIRIGGSVRDRGLRIDDAGNVSSDPRPRTRGLLADGTAGRRLLARVVNRKPLVGESKRLSTQIYYNLIDGAVEIGSPMQYAAVQNFGQKQGASGRMRNNAPIPLGDIPARQFIGVSDQDARDFLEAYSLYVGGLTG